jgi:23S rRNA (adenine2503-C2)-methyltransferase
MLALQALSPAQLHRAIPSLTLAEARKVVAHVNRDEPVRPSSGLRRASAEAVLAMGHVPRLPVVAEQMSRLDPFRKLVFETMDGHRIEAVRIPLERQGRFSACVSSQAGCALACVFCATGRMGLRRNLQTWEMVEQVRAIRRTLDCREGQRVHGVVFQGMGEPLANLDRVIEAIEVLSCPSAMAVDQRAITVSTSGLPVGIRQLGRTLPKVRLALSIHAARSAVRGRLMPVEEAHALDEVLDACVEHARITGLAPLWAMTLLAGFNDSVDDADAMAERAKTFESQTGLRPRITVVPYNSIDDEASQGAGSVVPPVGRVTGIGDATPWGGGPQNIGREGGVSPPDSQPGERKGRPTREGSVPATLERTNRKQEQQFRDRLHAQGVFTHRRYSGGADVNAACGQLRT